jgi:hypothetical protein
MSYNTWCKKGHSFVAADIYKDWPDGAPHCPICFVEWADENNFEVSDYMRKKAEKQKRHLMNTRNFNTEERAYLIGTNLYSFRYQEPAEIIDVVMVALGDKYKKRLCFVVKYKDGFRDWVAVKDDKNYKIVAESDLC